MEKIIMKRRTVFPDPDQGYKYVPKTSPPTSEEGVVCEKFDPLSPDRIENTVGVIIRCAVDIARYQRSLEVNPAHYRRLIRVTEYFANARLASTLSGGAAVDVITRVIEAVSWPEDGASVRARIVLPSTPYSGDEAPLVAFGNTPNANRLSLP